MNDSHDTPTVSTPVPDNISTGLSTIHTTITLPAGDERDTGEPNNPDARRIEEKAIDEEFPLKIIAVGIC